MLDFPTTEQRPTIYHETSSRRETFNDSQYKETPRLLAMTGLTTQSPNPHRLNTSTSKQSSPQVNQPIQQTYTINQQFPPTQVFSQLINSPNTLRLSSMVQQTHPVIHQVHYHEKPITVVPREELELIYHEKYIRMEQEMDKLLAENIKLRSVQASEKLTITEDTTRVNQLQFELERYIRITKEQELEIESWKKKYIEFEAQVQLQYGIEVDYIRLRNLLQETEITLRAEINAQKGLVQTWKDKYQDLERKIYGFNAETTQVQKTKESKIRELQGKIALMTTEVERVNVLINEKNDDIARWKNKYNDLENQTLEKDRLINQMNIEQSRLRAVIDQLNADIKVLKAKAINPAEFQQKINLQQQEIDKLTHIIKQLEQDNDNLKQDLHYMSDQLRDNTKYKSYQDQIFKLEGDLKKAQRNIAEREQVINELQKQILAQQQEMQNMQSSETHVTYLNTEINTWKHKFERLNKDFHSTQEALMIAEAELESIKKRGFAVQEISRIQEQTKINTTSKVNTAQRY